MKKIGNFAAVLATLAFLFTGLSGSALAQRSSDKQIRDIIRSLASKVDDFRFNLDYQLRSSSADRQEAGAVLNDLVNLDRKISDFQLNLDQHRENRTDVNAIIDSARTVDQFVSTSRQSPKVTSEWNTIRGLIDRLAVNYSVVPRWNDKSIPASYPTGGTASRPTRPVHPRYSSTSALSGTYQIDRNQSETADQIISTVNVDASKRPELSEKLDAPEQLSISIRGNEVTLASSKGSPVTFIADGSDKMEQDSSGRSIRTRATLRGQELTVSSVGGDNDYTVTFSTADGGRTLKVTRRITTDYLDSTIFADSVYMRTTDSVAQVDPTVPDSADNDTADASTTSSNGSYSDNDAPSSKNPQYGNSPVAVAGRTGQYGVPNGVILTGMLDTMVDTKVTQNNDRFKMTVQSPNEYRGAVIEGYVTGVGRSGRVSGSSNVTFNFEKITLRDGQTYDFAGFLQSVKDHNGKAVKVDPEGVVKGDSQTRQTAKRGGVGAGIGALIGVIAGGGTGAAIGAVIGGGVGAGSVIVQGRDDVRLMPGTMITVQSSSPIRTSKVQDN